MGSATSDELRVRAVVTAVIPYGETDAIVRLMTRELGRVGAFSRGARRGKRRAAPGAMPLSQAQARLLRRRGSDLFGLAELVVTTDPTGLGKDPVTFGRASYLVELIERLLPQADPSPPVFELLEGALELLASAPCDARLLRAFELKLLGHTGYLPDLAGPRAGPPLAFYDPESGQLCARRRGQAVAFGAQAQEAALLLCGAELHALPDIDDDTLRQVSRIFALHLRKQGVTNLKTVAFLKGLGG